MTSMDLINLRTYLNVQKIIYLPKAIQLCIALICCLCIWLFLYKFITLPIKTQLKHNVNFINNLTLKLNEQNKTLHAERSELHKMEVELNNFSTTKLQRNNLSLLLNELVALADKNHLEFDNIKPLSEEKKFNLLLQPIQISTIGHYPQIINFISQLTHFHSINIWDNITLKPVAADITTEKALQLSMTIHFYSKDNP